MSCNFLFVILNTTARNLIQQFHTSSSSSSLLHKLLSEITLHSNDVNPTAPTHQSVTVFFSMELYPGSIRLDTSPWSLIGGFSSLHDQLVHLLPFIHCRMAI
uniref:AlNc14C200G8666 protein n=1 Tax=Albugo laibachii Nc14 TaxID=890382 RepID=F0WQJ7_9STRA|nr:AlNc14C200G8666 [Albugo laibachii Nc14]CCA24159.1 AlNc14C224G9181 [Albugo laibachii Nc14]|eukprot:CCA24159.1 AlNc14C224G9181 [Albugo laibachii Nc14]